MNMRPFGYEKWRHRRDDPSVADGASTVCTTSCLRASRTDRPTRVSLTHSGRRIEARRIGAVWQALSMRPWICAECSLLQRWGGLYWCGVPWPVRQWRRVLASVSQVATWANVGDESGGCGCCLDLKWRLLVSPRSMLRQFTSAIAWAFTGETWNGNIAEVACPFGLWPKAL